MEVMGWKISNAAKHVHMTMSDDDEVQSFEHHMLTYQQTDDPSTHKEHANTVNAIANTAREEPCCTWCYKEKGSKWAHAEDNCHKKTRAESARDVRQGDLHMLCCYVELLVYLDEVCCYTITDRPTIMTHTTTRYLDMLVVGLRCGPLRQSLKTCIEVSL